jgi:predicted TIM-barrel fold metal-dependent hydrolase
MMIDTHTHLYYTGRMPGERLGISPQQLVDKMNENGIARSVVLPIESPEVGTCICMTETVIEAARTFPERIIPFIHVDPRMPRSDEVVEYLYNSCDLIKGFGETVTGLPVHDPLHKKLYAKCSDLGLPFVFYGSSYSNFDEVGLPGLESCLQEFPDLIMIGHGARWWNAISADDDASCGYPDTPIVPGGAADRLLQEYDNMYADISAGSGYNAVSRDPEFTQGFIERNWRKILFATDYLSAWQEQPQVQWMRETPMADEHRAAISEGNARRIMRLEN